MDKPFWDEQIETMPRNALRALQLERLRWQVERCYHQSAFYRERFDQAGAHPDSLASLDDVRRFPFVTKLELRDEQERFPYFGRYAVAPPSEWREVHPSTGTTGKAVHTIWSADDVANIADVTARTMWSFGCRPDAIVQNAFSYGLWVAGLAVHYACAKIGCLVVPIGAQLTERQIDYMLNLKSTILIATPSYGVYLAEQLRPHVHTSIRLRAGCFGGEPGAEVPATRQALEEGLGIKAYDYYGLAEIGPTFASECIAQAGLHWSEDLHLIEVIDPNTKEPVPEGERGVLVITHLAKQATPMIRYWTNDIVSVTTEPCPCGRTHARSPGGILGRADDMIIFMGTNFYPMQVEQVVRSFKELTPEYRIRLWTDAERQRDVCTIVVELTQELPPTSRNALHERLTYSLRSTLAFAPQIEFVSKDTLERTAFKARRVEEKREAFHR
jgi:phenylacetate-CoA ligase